MKRMYFLDNMRSATIVLVIIFHAALAYMNYVPKWWYVIDSQKTLAADIFVIWADVFIMPLMFFISGYFAIRSYKKNSHHQFWSSKIKRIALPWIFGVVIIAPVIAYMFIISRHLSLSFSKFYLQIFWSNAGYQQAHYWYLGALLALYVLMSAAYKLLNNKLSIYKNDHPSKLFFLSILFIGSLSSAVINLYYPTGHWIHPLFLIYLQTTRIPFYIIYFFLGSIAYENNWLQSNTYIPKFSLSTMLFIFASIIYIIYTLFAPSLIINKTIFIFLYAVLYSIFCLSAVMGSIAIFYKLFNYTTPFMTALSKAAYPMYYIHFLIILTLNYLFQPISISPFIKYFLVCIIGLILCFGISKFLLINIPPFTTSHKTNKRM